MMTTPRALRRARRVVAAGLVTAVAGFGLTSISSTPATAAIAPTSAVMVSPAIGTSSYENRVQHWINVRRSNHGLHTLTVASCTDQVAESWGRYLAVNDEFFHQSMTTILNKCNAYYAGETLGRGAISPKRLVYLWMHSPEHRQVLLSKYPRRIGIGAYPDAFGQWVVAADFMRF
jgi:uncharacterized protein YkwD